MGRGFESLLRYQINQALNFRIPEPCCVTSRHPVTSILNGFQAGAAATCTAATWRSVWRASERKAECLTDRRCRGGGEQPARTSLPARAKELGIASPTGS